MAPSAFLLSEVAFTLVLVSLVGVVFYNLFFHPLRRYPGPKLWAISNIPWNYYNLRLCLPLKIHELHQKYGSVVRIGPNQLSYNSGAAWKEIYFGTGTHEYLKDLHRGFGIPQDPNPKEWPMTVSDTPRHRRIRRALLPAFSERALRDQSPLLNSYLDILILRLRERAGKAPEDIITWVNRFTVDALGHFCFGQSFNALQDSKTPDLVNVLIDSVAYIPVSQFAQQYRLQKLLAVFTPAGAVNTMEAFNQHATEQVTRVVEQMKSGVASSGLFFSYVMEDKEAKSKISHEEVTIEGRMLLTAGAEARRPRSLCSHAVG
ncbi:Versicolorin B desaturase [Fonsecaea pedrosoi]|nr:Versicolorin B desaturase [Fonsecaea pedrosoi]